MPSFNRNRTGKSIGSNLDFRGKRAPTGKSVDLNWKGVGPKIAEYLLLAGGGSGAGVNAQAGAGGGGGGGGGIRTGTVDLLGAYTISIGGGGTASSAFGFTVNPGGNGGEEGPWGGGYGGGSGGGTGPGGPFNGSGGSGAASSITGSSLTYGGGGGGGGANWAPGGSPGSNTGGYGGGGAGNRWGGGGGGGGGVLILAYPSSDGTLTIGAGVSSTLNTSSRSGFNVYFLTGAGVITA